MAAGQIVWDLLMKTGSFITDTQRAEKQLRALRKSALDFKTVFAGSFAGGIATGAFQELVGRLREIPGALVDLTDQLSKIGDLSTKIGDTSESFASLATSAAASSTPLEQIAAASVRLTAALSKTDAEGEGAAQAVRALGLNFDQFKTAKPVEQLEILSNALAGFEDDQKKTAVAVALFGKAGADLLPFLKELKETGRIQFLTQDQIDNAKKASDAFAVLRSQGNQIAQVFAAEAAPAMLALAEATRAWLLETAEAAVQVDELTGRTGIAQFARDGAIALAGFVDSLRRVATDLKAFAATTDAEFEALRTAAIKAGSFVGAFDSGEVADALARRNKAVAGANAALLAQQQFDGDKFTNLVKAQFDAQDKLARQPKTAPKPRPSIDTSGLITSTESDQTAKKLLDNQIKALESVIKREGDLFSERNRFLNLYNEQGLLSIRAYYEAQQAIIDAATSAQVAAYDKQLDALEKARQAAKKPADVADLTGRIDDVVEKRAKVEQDAGAKSIELSIRRQQEEKRYADQIESTRAAVLELTGDLSGAAAIRFDLQNADIFRRAIAEGDEAALSLLQTLRLATIAQADFAKSSKDTQAVTEQLALQEDRIAISRQLGATTELESLQKLGVARQAAVKQLEAMVVAQEAIARASGNQELVAQAERARVALEQLKATADPLGDKFRSIFSDGLSGPLEEFINGTLSAKDAFNAFVGNVVAGISRIVAQNLAQSLFGNASSGVGSLIGTIAGAFGGARATGGDVMPGRSYWVGEQGPERFIPRTAGTILPASESAAMGGGRPLQVTNNFNISGPTDRRSEAQIAAAAGQGVQRAVERHT